MSLWDMLVYVAIIKAKEMMLTIKFNSKDTGVVDVILEIKFSNTSHGLVLSQSHERCNDSLMRTPWVKSICVFWEVFYKSKQTCIVGYLCLLFVYIGRAQSYGRSQHICLRHNTMRQLLSNGNSSRL